MTSDMTSDMTPNMTVIQANSRELDLGGCPDIKSLPGKAFARIIGPVLVAFCLVAVFPAGAIAGEGAGEVADGATGYFEALADLPIAPGLAERPDEAMVFDKPDGRIVEVVATGVTPMAAVEEFYKQVLPALGWALSSETRVERGAELTFEREGENLRLAIGRTENDDATRLVVEVSPE